MSEASEIKSILNRPLRFLIVEDDAADLVVLGKLLHQRGIEVSSCSTAATAMKLINEEKEEGKEYDVVMADLNIPGIRGEDFILWLSENHPQSTPVVVTGMEQMEAIRRLKVATVLVRDDRIKMKPFTEDDLVKLLRDLNLTC
jgi:DNA-binding NtrC family response regulator